ncbi:MAG: hypothetical protein MUC87_20950 [Bacteroidia bacterium]|jgi:hypothetical protein|nr:hypothetical protein [Bacteroidia bacterium]
MTARFLLLFVFIFGGVLHTSAQLFIPVSDDPFGVPFAFNRDSVLANKIRFVNIALQYKPDQQLIEDKGLREYYQFDTLGNLTLYWRSRVRATRTEEKVIPAVYRRGRRIRPERVEYRNYYVYDTVFVQYTYDSLSRLNIRRLCDGDYYSTWYYTWNKDNTLAVRIHVRETNLGRNHTNFILGVQTVISEEQFRYEKYLPRQLTQIALNDDGKPFRQTISDFDETGRVLEERLAFIVGGHYNTYRYEYDSLGRLSSRLFTMTGLNSGEELLKYTRDSLGRLDHVRLYREAVLHDEYTYLYQNSSSLPYAFINRRHQQAGIDIVKLYYNEAVEEKRSRN